MIKINSSENKRLLSNIFSLGVLQGVNYILPLITFPYLIRVLGIEYFGLLSFSMATITYFKLITEYGFNLSATRQISINRENEVKVNEIFSSVMMIKSVLMILSFIMLFLLVFSFDRFAEHWEVYFITFGVVFGQFLFPVWLFQGVEQMKFITYLTLISRFFSTFCIFVFVSEESDYLLVPLFSAIGFIVVGIISIYLIRVKLQVSFIWQSKSVIKFQLIEGWYVFISSIAISLYTVSITFILGLFTNDVVVGYFSAADKIVQAVKGLYQPISQAIYPLIGEKMNKDKGVALSFIRKVFYIVGSTMFIVSFLLFLSAEFIINILLGIQYYQSVLLLKIMAFLPFFITLSNLLGVQIMLNLGYKREFSYIVLITAVSGLFLTLLLTNLYEAVGVSIATLLVEILVTIMLGLFILFKIKRGVL